VRVRQLRAADARSLTEHLNDKAVCRYIAPCPSTIVAMTRFISWTHRERRRGKLACFGIVPSGSTHAVGVIQVWPVERDFSTAEWGFVLGRRFWGTDVFVRGARLVLDVVFSQIGVYRLEARVVDANHQAHRVMEKLGATIDGRLRGAFCDGRMIRDQVMWSILAPEAGRAARGARHGR
jgi:RimJ/RimL family protein N-acetyltransferase